MSNKQQFSVEWNCSAFSVMTNVVGVRSFMTYTALKLTKFAANIFTPLQRKTVSENPNPSELQEKKEDIFSWKHACSHHKRYFHIPELLRELFILSPKITTTSFHTFYMQDTMNTYGTNKYNICHATKDYGGLEQTHCSLILKIYNFLNASFLHMCL